MHVEHIDLIPHPMDAWRAALNALIACAPGDGPAIAAHLAEAREHALVIVDRTLATPGTAKLVDRLMLIGAGRLVGDRLTSQDVQPMSAVQAAVRLHQLMGLDAALDPFIGVDYSRAGRCARLAHAMGLSVQSVYQRLQDEAEAKNLDEAEALNRLEALHLPGADQ
ncbi:TPA: hypothetical protein SLV86_001292 [Pseudomonas aeruginosa]|nr:hypothetical protein [Pseudomonas aeruginosa]HEJ2039538.1 hypothetical protein [Pseudomonas aeruginosa]